MWSEPPPPVADGLILDPRVDCKSICDHFKALNRLRSCHNLLSAHQAEDLSVKKGQNSNDVIHLCAILAILCGNNYI